MAGPIGGLHLNLSSIFLMKTYGCYDLSHFCKLAVQSQYIQGFMMVPIGFEEEKLDI